MASYYVQNPNNSTSGSFSSSASMASTGFKDKNNKKSSGKKCGAKAVKLSTDPQSIAARQRRHRISDRFKTLQSLVPGGSKLDTVSMLEEAIQYVKFLKNQIWIHQSMDMMISSSDYHVEDHKYCTDQLALAQPGNYDGESEACLGSNDDFFAQMQLSELPCALPEGLHLQGQNCTFDCDSTRYFGW